jgi:hypothetical protein
MRNQNNFLVLWAVALFAISCTKESSSHIQVSAFPLLRPNPTSYSFPYSLQKTHSLALEAFSIDHQIDKPIFGKLPLAFDSILSAETSTNAVFSENIFRDPANTNDIYLHSFHDPIAFSSVYHEQGTGLPFIAVFQLHLSATNSNETIVTIIASNTEVIDGQQFGIGPCGPGMANRYEPVQPTTVEEYIVLRYLGNYMGITNMPAVIVPAP